MKRRWILVAAMFVVMSLPLTALLGDCQYPECEYCKNEGTPYVFRSFCAPANVGQTCTCTDYSGGSGCSSYGTCTYGPP